MVSAYVDALERLAPLAQRQHGVLSVRQLRRAGVAGRALEWSIRNGLLVQRRVMVYECVGSPRTRVSVLVAAVLDPLRARGSRTARPPSCAASRCRITRAPTISS
jgi:hypothetical protein